MSESYFKYGEHWSDFEKRLVLEKAVKELRADLLAAYDTIEELKQRYESLSPDEIAKVKSEKAYQEIKKYNKELERRLHETRKAHDRLLEVIIERNVMGL